MEVPKKERKFLEYGLIFALIYLLTNTVLRAAFPDRFAEPSALPTISLKAMDATVKGGHHPILVLKNGTKKELVLQDRCPAAPVDVFYAEAGEASVSGEPFVSTETAVPCVPVAVVPAGGQVTFDLAPWKYALFDRTGSYAARLMLPEGTGSGQEITAHFVIYEAGFMTKLFRTFITKPFLNFLIFTAGILPNHSLAISIIILTILVKILLFFPTQHALEGQKGMQQLQPKLDELKKKYGSDAQKLQQETMKLWKEHGVNPFQSCLPMLVQFPVLIGLFYTIRDGSVLALSRHLIYEPYQHLTWTFDTHFLGFNLLQPSLIVFPILLVLLQFFQMKLSFALSERKKAKEKKIIDVPARGEKGMSAANVQQKMMLYGLPLMIGFFAFQFPTAVSLYWGISTLFAIGQQIVVNRKTA